MEKRLSELTEADIGITIGIDIGFQQIEKGKLTDLYGAIDENEQALIAVEIDDGLTFFLPSNSLVQIG